MSIQKLKIRLNGGFFGKTLKDWFVKEFSYEFLEENEKREIIIKIKYTREIIEVNDDVYTSLIIEREKAKKIRNEILDLTFYV